MSFERDDESFEDQAPTAGLGAMGRARARARGLRLTVLAGPDAGTTATIARRTATVGRAADADFRLTDRTVSTFHAELSARDDGVHVRDLNSRNGTRCGSARLEQAVLEPGASLLLGETLLRVELDAPFDAAVHGATTFGELRGVSAPMRELFATLARLARTSLSVVIEGETGTGKELVARALHTCGPRGAGPFCVLDCAAVPATLAESILFGHEKGAFTGATERRAGVFESAHGGTVFLDEVGELPVELQPKLLRVLERREVVRLGAAAPRPVDVRVLSATWRDLRTMVNQGRFREDLYFRLAQAHVVVPSLRERREDIPLLAEHFLAQLPPDVPHAEAFAPDALAQLMAREFPGNVRELKNTVERAAVTAEGAVVTLADLAFERLLAGERAVTVAPPPPLPTTTAPPSVAPARGAAPGGAGTDPLEPFKDAKNALVEQFERDYLERLVARTGRNLSRAAAVAGIDRRYLRDLLRKHGLRSDARGEGDEVE